MGKLSKVRDLLAETEGNQQEEMKRIIVLLVFLRADEIDLIINRKALQDRVLFCIQAER